MLPLKNLARKGLKYSQILLDHVMKRLICTKNLDKLASQILIDEVL